MSPRRAYGARGASARAGDADDKEAFKLVAIRHASPPEGCAGRDWLIYEIVQGTNRITGYRRGTVASATEEVEKIVLGLNERRGPTPPKQTASGPRAAVAPVGAGDTGAVETMAGASAGEPI